MHLDTFARPMTTTMTSITRWSLLRDDKWQIRSADVLDQGPREQSRLNSDSLEFETKPRARLAIAKRFVDRGVRGLSTYVLTIRIPESFVRRLCPLRRL